MECTRRVTEEYIPLDRYILEGGRPLINTVFCGLNLLGFLFRYGTLHDRHRNPTTDLSSE